MVLWNYFTSTSIAQQKISIFGIGTQTALQQIKWEDLLFSGPCIPLNYRIPWIVHVYRNPVCNQDCYRSDKFFFVRWIQDSVKYLWWSNFEQKDSITCVWQVPKYASTYFLNCVYFKTTYLLTKQNVLKINLKRIFPGWSMR